MWIASYYRPPYNFEGMLWGPGRYYADPDPYVAYWLHPKGIANQSRVNDPEITALIDKQATQLNPKERWDTLQQIQRLEAKNVYYLWKASGDTQVLTNKRVHDFSGDLHYNSHEYLYTWVDA